MSHQWMMRAALDDVVVFHTWQPSLLERSFASSAYKKEADGIVHEETCASFSFY